MEDVSVRAITIGVGVLLAIITMSAVFSYYNTAKQAVRDIGAGTDIAGLYEKSVRDVLVKAENGATATITGTDVKNLLYYAETNNDLNITLNNVNVYDNTENKIKQSSDSKTVLKTILPNGKYKINGTNPNYIISNN